MSKRQVNLYLEDIELAIRKIEKFTNGLSYADFSKNELIVDATVRNLEIIGEAARNIPADFKKKAKSIPWEQIAGMRNKITHEYFGISLKILWQTIKGDIPKLKKELAKIKIPRTKF